MTSKKRVFSNDFDNNYIDYLKIKNGETILKNIKSKTREPFISYFINYNEFLNITKAYYKFIDNDLCTIKPIKNLYNSNLSYITYDKVLKHINVCDYCSKNNNYNQLYQTRCEELLGILYPYGEYITNNISNIYFPNHIYLDKWCNAKKNNCIVDSFIDKDIINNFNNIKEIKEIKENNKINDNLSKKCGIYGLCKNAKPLFVG